MMPQRRRDIVSIIAVVVYHFCRICVYICCLVGAIRCLCRMSVYVVSTGLIVLLVHHLCRICVYISDSLELGITSVE